MGKSQELEGESALGLKHEELKPAAYGGNDIKERG